MLPAISEKSRLFQSFGHQYSREQRGGGAPHSTPPRNNPEFIQGLVDTQRRGQDSNTTENLRENIDLSQEAARNPARSPLEDLLHSLWTVANDTSRLQAIAILQEGKTSQPPANRSRHRLAKSGEPVTRAAYEELANWPLIQRLLLLLGKNLTDSQKKTVNEKIRELTFDVADFSPETR